MYVNKLVTLTGKGYAGRILETGAVRAVTLNIVVTETRIQTVVRF